jgi:hypothetical protein
MAWERGAGKGREGAEGVDVDYAPSPQPLEVVLAGHPAIHDPDPPGHAVARLHRLDDLLHGRHIRAIAGEDLVPHGHALSRDHQPLSAPHDGMGDLVTIAVGGAVHAATNMAVFVATVIS